MLLYAKRKRKICLLVYIKKQYKNRAPTQYRLYLDVSKPSTQSNLFIAKKAFNFSVKGLVY